MPSASLNGTLFPPPCKYTVFYNHFIKKNTHYYAYKYAILKAFSSAWF